MVEEKELDHWTTEEKLLVPFQREADKEGRSTFWFIFSVVMLSAALISLAEEVQHIETVFPVASMTSFALRSSQPQRL